MLQGAILQCITDPEVDARTLLNSISAGNSLTGEQRDAVLALRGHLASGVLRHNMLMRHKVQFGIRRTTK